VEQLVGYLTDYFHRAKPLEDLDKILTDAATTFEIEWESGAFPGWSQSAADEAKSAAASSQADIDLSRFESPQV
jgi:splicing factor 3A subunit 3